MATGLIDIEDIRMRYKRASRGIFIIKQADLFYGSAVFLKIKLDALSTEKYALAMDSNISNQVLNIENTNIQVTLEWYYKRDVKQITLNSHHILYIFTEIPGLAVILLKNQFGSDLWNKKAYCFNVSSVSIGDSLSFFQYSNEESNDMRYKLKQTCEGRVRSIEAPYYFSHTSDTYRGSIIINNESRLVGINLGNNTSNSSAAALSDIAIHLNNVKDLIREQLPNLASPEDDSNIDSFSQVLSSLSGRNSNPVNDS